MMYDNEPLPIIQETNSISTGNNIAMITQVINFTGDKSFILNSLQRIKNSTLCDIKRKLIDTFITEYTVNFTGYTENDSYNVNLDSKKVSSSYAKKSYEKVVREQEYLHKIITTLNPE
ncbi:MULTISPECIES: hypothetical protein [Chryseobacterium]|uniref:Uncharacterized protein n=1 Tax=Chryseobacterium taihuense TaxID=1141221 RepID=A0A4U8W969_9FLAO|nr:MULTISPECIES: hypothetical protein [Chryseobacterium]QQV04057.1 hypothetical protein I6I61_06915 [Chryseobacterium sp. FDAARGOS 1104]VFB02583.1 Uncharacterised protein [Chryseobacterium taihuense]